MNQRINTISALIQRQNACRVDFAYSDDPKNGQYDQFWPCLLYLQTHNFENNQEVTISYGFKQPTDPVQFFFTFA